MGEQTLQVQCLTCGGKGHLAVQVQGTTQVASCGPCHGKGLVHVRTDDPRWQVLLPNGAPRGQRAVLMVTHGGSLAMGEPLTQEEVRHLASTVTGPEQSLHASVVLALSEMARLAQEVRRLQGELARAKAEVAEARIDAAAVRRDLRSAGVVREDD